MAPTDQPHDRQAENPYKAPVEQSVPAERLSTPPARPPWVTIANAFLVGLLILVFSVIALVFVMGLFLSGASAS
jgi:hypothetical protein